MSSVEPSDGPTADAAADAAQPSAAQPAPAAGGGGGAPAEGDDASDSMSYQAYDTTEVRATPLRSHSDGHQE